jgi:DNA (cytosine-5)-methyltransferase 1
MPIFNSIDLFSGCGGLTEGMRRAGFTTRVAVEIDASAVKAFKLNHKKTIVIQRDIRSVDISDVQAAMRNEPVHLLAGCPPCQGFSRMRKLNRRKSVIDSRNSLVAEYLRFVKALKPLTIMMENVPGLQDYYLFKEIVKELDKLGYNPKVAIVNVRDFSVPQSRKRLVLVGSILGNIDVARPVLPNKTVRHVIGNLPLPERSKDPIHKIFPSHTFIVQKRIDMTPKNGGSRKDLPKAFILNCHKRDVIGFSDVYGRLRWDDYSTTITGGCLNPSKGRFLHPEQNRCISAREAALLQSFPINYKFPVNIPKADLALMIGNALPPMLSYFQSENIRKHLIAHLG